MLRELWPLNVVEDVPLLWVAVPTSESAYRLKGRNRPVSFPLNEPPKRKPPELPGAVCG